MTGQTPPLSSLTKVWHNTSYPAIDPKSRPELSTAGKVVVVTGAGAGIGRAIAYSFASAGSTQIALLGRTEKTLSETAASIKKSYPNANILLCVADIANKAAVDAAFEKIATTFGKIDICVSNAGVMPAPGPIADADADQWMKAFEANVRGPLLIAQAFLRNAAENPILLNTSTGFVHTPAGGTYSSSYIISKTAGTRVFEFIADENPSVRVVNVQPGIVATPGAAAAGVQQDVDDPELPGDFYVWLSSSEAAFLNGKYVWSNWDVDELKAMKEKIVSTGLLTIGLDGVSFHGFRAAEHLPKSR